MPTFSNTIIHRVLVVILTTLFLLQMLNLMMIDLSYESGKCNINDPLNTACPHIIPLRDDYTVGNGLSTLKHRYYIYNVSEYDILLEPEDNYPGSKEIWSIYEALQIHPLRTLDPNEATFFIPPIFVNMVHPRKSKHPSRRYFLKALDIVTSSNIYQSTMGSRHIFIAIDGHYFGFQNSGSTLANEIKYYSPAWLKRATGSWLIPSYPSIPCPWEKFENLACLPARNIFNNIILARDRDSWEIRQRVQHNNESYSSDWTGRFLFDSPIPPNGFSFGLMLGTMGLQLIEPTYDKFKDSKWTYFYHTRPDAFGSNSTVYRHAPLKQLPSNGTEEAATYVNSSVGYDIDANEWKERFVSSKFCLILRGDTPHSKALLRSIRVGCIPVIVSDVYSWYAPSFKSTLDMSHYTIRIGEDEFLRNPWGELHRLYTQFTEAAIRQKLRALTFAQRVIFPDHQDSLFVPAFLKEAWESVPRAERMVGCVNRLTKETVPCL